jgi:hypothetical protein
MGQAGTIINYRGDKKNKNAVQSTDGKGHIYSYKPANKSDRDARKRVFDRYKVMRDDPIRNGDDGVKQWDMGRKMYRMWAPTRAADDWGADIILPDGFSAMQTYLQETIDARFRPILEGVESSDEVLAWYNNSIFQHAMDTTEFDQETTKARSASSMMGTAFTREEYRYETREVMDPISFEDGEIKYKKKEILDYDDVYTRYVRPENCFMDPGAEDQKYAMDCIYREVLEHDVFMEMYKDKPGFKDVDKVVPAGSLDKRAGFFEMADDIEEKDVEVLHYENRLTDSYDVLANNVLIRKGPMPNKHKELTLDVWTFYPVEGQIYGMGIPRIIYTLVEERRTNRNQQLDRNTLHNSKMFLANDLFDLDEDDLTPRPHGLIKVNTNGLPISQAVMPLEYGDTPISSVRMDDTLLADQRRAHGMQESSELPPGATATQAAIIKESTQRRIALVNTLMVWNTLIRIGKKKWSNIQFFYPAARVERVLENNKWHETKKYRTIKTQGRSFNVYGDPENGEQLQLRAQEIPGKGRFKLDPTFARFMLDDFDITMDAAAMAIISKPIKAQQMNEMWDRLMNNPIASRYVDGAKALQRMLRVNDENPSDWLPGDGASDAQMQQLAENENLLFIDMVRTGKLFALPGTPGATEAHTLIHMQFTKSKLYQDLPDAIKQIIANHIMEENENNPNTKNIADLAGAAGGGGPAMGGGPDQGGGGNAVPLGQPGGAPAGDGMGALPGAPMAGAA